MSQKIRVDRGEFNGKVERTEEGYLRGDAIVTRTGVFMYRNDDGSVRRELRHPDDVYEAESLASLRMIPITDNHPGELVTSINAASLSRGQTGENIRVDGKFVVAPLTITHADMIATVEDGKVELSLGYVVDVVEEEGEYNGEVYTHRQKNIRYNHLAVVDRARAGAAARLNMDGAAVQEQTTQRDDEGKTMLKKINLDGIEYEAAPEVINALTRADQKAADLEAKVEDANKRADTAEAKADAAEEKLEELKKDNSDEKVRQRIDARLELERNAARLIELDEKDKGLGDRELMLKAISARNDKLDLAEKSDEYVRARFDSFVEDAEQDGIRKQRETVNGGRKDDRGDRKDEADSEQARKNAEDSVKNAWRGKRDDK